MPALVGLLRDVTTGLPITDGQETLTPTTGEKDPGPTAFNASGIFAWPTLDPGGYTRAPAGKFAVSPTDSLPERYPEFPDGDHRAESALAHPRRLTLQPPPEQGGAPAS